MQQPRRVNRLAIGLCSLGACMVLALGLSPILQGRRGANGQSIGQMLRYRGLTPTVSTVANPPPIALERDPWATAVEQATHAATRAQTAQGAVDWNVVAQAWLGAIVQLQQLDRDDPRHFFAQKKLNEYLHNFLYAQQQATRGASPLVYPSFGSQRLDEQLTLYLSYVATLGPPDILIVGSSRALQGVDPSTLQQSLAAQGISGVQVFNFGINGATAQVVDVLLRQILPPETLPRLILWADGVRAFNSGRRDRTYEALLKSPGYQRVLMGDLPRLRPAPAAIQDAAYDPMRLDGTLAGYRVACTDCVPVVQVATPFAQRLSWRIAATAPPLPLGTSSIDANGFLPVSRRFDPTTYFRQHPRVSGLYDGDYAAFNLGGLQTAAFDRVLALSRDRQIPLILVNLPLTAIYLDATRSRAETEFAQTWQVRANREGFYFRDYARRWPQNHAFFDDPSHLNQAGAAAIAQLLAQDRSLPFQSLPKSRNNGVTTE
ncbi:hypothetical protein [Trichothermofontia sp.]